MSTPVPEDQQQAIEYPRKLAEAQEQADEYSSFARSGHVIAHKTGEKFTIPNLMLLDDDQLIAYQELQHKLNTCDRWPDAEVPDSRIVNKDKDGAVFEQETGAHTKRGEFMQPYQKDGELITPPYEIQMAVIFWGQEGYERFKAGGGRSSEIPLELRRMKIETDKRMASDSKSDDSGVVLDSVPSGDSG